MAAVVVEPVKVKESSPVIMIPGSLIPRDKVEVKAPTSARVSEVLVNKGDRVKQGDVLAKLSEEDINLKLSQLRAAKKESEASVEKNSYVLKNRDKLLEDGKIDKTQYDGAEIENNSASATIKRIDADIAALELDLSRAQITSPVNGIITDKMVSPATMISENATLFTIINIDPILISFPLTADESASIKVGTLINVNIDDVGNAEYTATVTYISPDVRLPARTFDVWASIPNADGTLKAGMQGTARFTSTNIHKIIVVPEASLISRDHDRFIFTVVGGVARETKVGVRNIYDDVAEISSGLAQNDLIVVGGASSLQDGSTVDMMRR